ncbi:MAG: Trans-aconitate 2-methyltransferase [uncultured Acidimicrobiales bacterium]|uniref:Trans-aconitate 2-methyltransferase n=1 Tax=uncultured Acidimicrobiales bacterium TaxID=310071 RepID=A0A6J4I396_9ACTN|nr:MAG: Trans-aconitate 2-methyltransferase [uncultured Acidimicrobiales bacterium]
MPDTWDPAQYNRYASEREQPFWDLAGLVTDVPDPVVVDLGCGDGRLTAELHGRLGASSTTGVDSSAAMISAAQAHETSSVRFVAGDISRWQEPEGYDVVFANASLQWVPDHQGVLTRWFASLRPDGQIAVQVPKNADHPAHTVAAAVAAELLDDPPPDPVAENVLAPEDYAVLLDDLGCVEQHVRLQVYGHHLASTADVVEWVKGTTLTRFKEPLGPERWEAFVETYRERLLAEMGERSPYFYPFKRILIWGRRA